MPTIAGALLLPAGAGDANGDGEIDGKDVIALMQYLAQYDPAAGVSSEEVSEHADCNGDGTINGADAVRLLQYLANYNHETGDSSVELG